jgi:uncharacterized membrane protein YheB (UPF0754 family)
MSVPQSCIILFISAAGGWLIATVFLFLFFKPYSPKKILGFSVKGILPHLLPGLAKKTAAAIVQNYLSVELIEEKVNDPALMIQLRPQIENHVDRFLEKKLPETFPLLAKFMGEKTLFKFKEAFLTEVETIFPDLVKSYGHKVLNMPKTEQLIEAKINSIPIGAIKDFFYREASSQILLFKIIGLLFGLFIGTLQIILLLLIK